MGTSLGTVIGLIQGLSTLATASELANFPTTGRTGVLYLAEDTGILYRWDGSAYVAVVFGASPITTIGSYDASTGLPALTGLVNTGDAYIVTVAGTQLINTVSTDLFVGDLIVRTSSTDLVVVPLQTALMSNVTDGRIPMIESGRLADSSLRETATQIISEKSIVVPQGSVGIGAGLTLSEIGGELLATSNVTGNRYLIPIYPLSQQTQITTDDRAMYSKLGAMESDVVINSDQSTDTTITSFTYSPTFSFIHFAFSLIVVNDLTNFRARVTSTATNEVTRYFPSRRAWEAGTGVSLASGTTQVFTPYTVVDGDEQLPFRYTQGVTYTIEYAADQAVVLRGDGTVPYLIADIQRITQTNLLEDADITGLGTDNDAIHDNVAGEINAIAQKSNPVNADILVIEDSADSFNKKKITVESITGGMPPTLPVVSIHDFSINLPERVDISPSPDPINGNRTVTYSTTNYSQITSLELQLNTVDNVTLTLPTSDGQHTETITLSGIDLTSQTNLDFRVQANNTINSNTQRVEVRDLTQQETAYYGVSTSDNDDTIDVSNLTSRMVEDGDVFIVTFTLPADNYAIFLIPNNLAITKLVEQVFDQDSLADFTKTDDVRVIGTVTYDSYVLQNGSSMEGDLALEVTIGNAS